MRTVPNKKIIFHWILVISVIGLLVSYIEINTTWVLILISFFVLTLILNRTTYLNLKNGQLIISKKSFLVIPTFKLSIDLNKIDKFTMIDSRDDNYEDTRMFVDFEAGIIVDILTGIYFYKPTYTLIIASGQNNLTEIKINTQKKDVIKIEQELKKNTTY